MNEKVLITGGSGFIGSHTAAEAVGRGLNVIVFDRHGKRGFWPWSYGDVDVFMGDIRDYEAVQEAVNKVDYVINLAGILGTQETIRKPIPSVQTNIVGTINVLEAMIPNDFHNVQGAQIGVGNYWMNNSYSITKDTATRFCLMYNAEHKTKMGMVRALNAYGPGQKHEPVRKIIPTFIMKALNNQPIEIYGDGEQIMDMIHVKDVAKILLDIATDEDVDYQTIYDAGTARPTSVNWIAEQVIAAADSKSEIVHIPMRPGEPKGSIVIADPNMCYKSYNLIPFEQGIGTTVTWYREFYKWKSL